jgi:hypothetical protein
MEQVTTLSSSFLQVDADRCLLCPIKEFIREICLSKDSGFKSWLSL